MKEVKRHDLTEIGIIDRIRSENESVERKKILRKVKQSLRKMKNTEKEEFI